MGLDLWRAIDEETTDGVHDREEHKRQIVGHKRRRVPSIFQEHGEAREEADDNGGHDDIPREEGLQRALERQRIAIKPLRLHPLVEPDVRISNPEPRHQPCNSSHVGEPSKHPVRPRLDAHVAQAAEQGAKDDGDVGEATACRARKDLGRVVREGETVERTRRGVEIGRGGGPCGGEESGVDDGGETLDACSTDGNDKGRGESVGLGTEIWVVRRYEDTDDECALLGNFSQFKLWIYATV